MRAQPSEREQGVGARSRQLSALARRRSLVISAIATTLIVPVVPARATVSTSVPDTTVVEVPPETTVPDTTVPDTSSPDTTTADTAPDTTATTTPETAPTESAPSVRSIIVKVRSDLDARALAAVVERNGGEATSFIEALHQLVVEVPSVDADAAIASYRADADVVSVSVDRVREVEGAASDPGYGSQWGLRTIGWDQVHGEVALAGGVRVAVLDTGVAEIDDLAGRVGAGFSAFGTDPRDDANGHGTQMASIVAAATDNGAGIAGVAYGNVTVLPVQVLDGNGEGSDSDIIEGLVWAVDNGADVVLMAFSNPGYSAALQDAINYAWYSGVVVVAAAGNDGSATASYPAGSSKVVGVGGSTASDTMWSGSNQSAAVYLTAPAVGISSIGAAGDLVSVSGTSAAAAMVAGAAAVLRGADGSASNAVIVGRLARNADPLADSTLGNGRLNLARAVADASTEGVTPMGVTGGGGPVVGPYTAELFKPASVTAPSVTEGAASTTTTMTFTVTPSQYGTQSGGSPTFGTASTLYWRTNGGTATAGTAGGSCGAAGVDYIPIAAGAGASRSVTSTATFDITVTVCGDNLGEAGETIILQVSDAANFTGSNTVSSTGTITNDDANQAPVNTAPATQYVDEDTTLTFSSANTNAISISDVDAGTASVSVTLTATNGTIRFNGTTAASVTMSGTITAINTALNGVVYTPTANFNGPATLTILTSDGGNTGSGGAQSDSDVISITVNPVNDLPSFLKGANQTVVEDSGLATIDPWATAISAGPANESGQTLTFTVTNNNPTLFSGQPAVSSAGVLTFRPADNANGSAQVSVNINDSEGGSSLIQTFIISVTAVNDAPSFTAAGDVSVDEDSAPYSQVWATAISAGPSNESTQTVAFTVDATDKTLFSSQPAISANGTLTFTPATDAFGSTSVSVIAVDSDTALSPTQTFTITIVSVNDAPTFIKGPNQSVQIGGDPVVATAWATGISAGPANESGQTVTFAVVATDTSLFSVQPALSPSGTLTFAPASDAFGSTSVSVIASDSAGAASSAQTFTITVFNPTNPPYFTKGDNVTVLEDSSTYSAPWATDYSPGAGETGDVTFTVVAVNKSLFSDQPAIDSTGVLTFTPDANAFGTTSVSVTAYDEFTAPSTTETFTITITGINDPPTFVKGANQTVDEDAGSTTVPSWATSISAGAGETGTVTFQITTSNDALFSVLPAVSSSGTLTYTPASNAFGSATVSVTATDADGATSGTETFSITVRSVNDAPSFTKGADQTVNEDSGRISVANWVTGISPGPADESSQTVSFTVIATTTSLFSEQPAVSPTGTLTYTPAAEISGSTSVSITATDSAGATSAAQTFTITINAVNDPPSFTGVSVVTVNEDSGSYNQVWATSISPGPGESGTVTFTTSAYDTTLFSAAPAIGTNGRLTFTPGADKFGSTSVTVTASDGSATSVQTFTINITAVNDAPSFAKGTDRTVLEDAGVQTVTGWATAISAGPGETGVVTFTVTATNTSLFSVQPAVTSAGDLSFTPALHANGSTSVSVTARDPEGATSAAQSFTIAITAVNDAPVFTKGATVTVNEDSGAHSAAWATGISPGGGTDESSQRLTFTVTAATPSLFSSQPSISDTGVLSFTPAANANGETTVTVVLSDNGSNTSPNVNTSAPQTFTINITAVNDAPSFTPGSNQLVNEDSGTRTVANWATNMSPGPSNESGQTISFSVGNSNYYLFTESGQPKVSPTGELTFTLEPNANGFATVTVTAIDSGLGGWENWPNVNESTSSSFTITVSAVNDAPVFTKGADIAVNEDSGAYSAAWATGVSAGPSDESSQTLTFTVTPTTTSLFSVQPAVSAAGVLSFTPALNATGTTSVTVRLTDSGSNTSPNVNFSDTQTFTITLRPVNDAPVATASSVSVSEDSSSNLLTLSGTDVETASANLTEVIVSLPTKGVLRDGATTITDVLLPYTLPATGHVTYVPNSNYSGPDSFTFKVRDLGQPNDCGAASSTCSPALDSVVATVTISVTEVNDAPSLSLPTNTPIVVTRNVYVDGEISYDPITGLPVTYPENLGSGLWVTETSSATVVDPGAIVSDDSVDFKGGSLTVSSGSHSAGGSILGDRLGIRHQGSGAGQIGISSRDVLYGGVLIGSFSGGDVQGGTLKPLVITFNTRAADPSVSRAAVEALLKNITFWNDVATVKDPAETRVLSFLLNDGGLTNDPINDANARKLVYVEPVYNPPTIVLGSGPFTVLEQAAPFALAPAATLSDLDTTNFSGAVLTVDYTTAVSTLNQITIRDGAGSGGDPVNIEGGFLYYGNTKIGSWRNGDNGSALVVKFSARSVTKDQVQDVIRAILFANTSDAPMAQRTLRFKLDDGTGAVTEPRPTVVVNITAVNDNPTFTLGRSSATYTEDAAPAVLSPKVTVTDPDGTSLSGPTLTVRFIANGRTEDELGILDEGLVAGKIGVRDNQVYWSGSPIGTFRGGTAESPLVVSLVGSIPVTVVDALAQNITYRNTSQAPVTTSRTVGLLLADGSGGAAPEATLTLNVVAVNDAPINTVPTGVTVDEDFTVSGLVASFTDIDAGSSATLEVTLTAADGQVTFGGTTGASVTKTGTMEELNTLLNGFTFAPAANFFGDTTITMLTSDLGNTGTPGPATDSDDIVITVNPINDAPVFVVGTNPSVLEDSGEQSIAVMSSVSAGPLEDDLGQEITFTVTNVTDSFLFTAGGQPVMNSAGVVTFTPVADISGTSTVTVKATDDGSNTSPHVNVSGTQTFTITINKVNDPPSFDLGTAHVVDEDSGINTVPNWATDISFGPANEAPQTVWFTITNVSKPELFSAGPVIAADGTLTYSTAPNAFGTATITVIATDSGPGTAPNVNVSAPQTFDITLDPVNDGPTFALGTDPEVYEDLGPWELSTWVNDISAGPGEDLLGQTIEFNILTNTNPDLFSTGPAIDENGKLTFSSVENAFGVATLTVQAVDSDLDALPDINASTIETFTITVLPVNDPPFIRIDEADASTQTTIQYSDGIAPVTVIYGDVDSPVDEDNLWATYSFTPATGASIATSTSGLPKGLELVSLSAPSSQSSEGQVRLSGRLLVPAGTYTVTIGITDGDQTYPGPGSAEAPMTYSVDHEDAEANYTGDTQVLTAGPTVGTASVLLRAHLVQSNDGFAGSYEEEMGKPTRVRWEIFSAGNTTQVPDFVFPTLDLEGVAVDEFGWAQMQAQLPVGSYRVEVVVPDDPYWRGNPSIIAMNVTSGSKARRVTGGGWILDTESTTRKGTFSFNAAPQRDGSIRGNASYMFGDAQGYTWRIRTSSWQPGALTYYPDLNRSILQGKATVQKINAAGIVVATYYNWSIAISMYDGTSVRRSDMIGIVILRDDGSEFRRIPVGANVLDGYGRTIGGGNITVFR